MLKRSLPLNAALMLAALAFAAPLRAEDAVRVALVATPDAAVTPVADALTESGFTVVASGTSNAFLDADKKTAADLLTDEALAKSVATRTREASKADVLIVAVGKADVKEFNPDLNTQIVEAQITLQAIHCATGTRLARVTGQARGTSSSREKAKDKALAGAVRGGLSEFVAAVRKGWTDPNLTARALTVKLTNLSARMYDTSGRAFLTALAAAGAAGIEKVYIGDKKELTLRCLFAGDASALEKRLQGIDGALRDFRLENSTGDVLHFSCTLQEVGVALFGALPDPVKGAGLTLYGALRQAPAAADATWNFVEAERQFTVTTAWRGGGADLHRQMAQALKDWSGLKDLHVAEVRPEKVVYRVGANAYRIKVQGLSQDFYADTGRKVARLVEAVPGVQDVRKTWDAATGELALVVVFDGAAAKLDEAIKGSRDGLGELSLVETSDTGFTYALAVRAVTLEFTGADPAIVRGTGSRAYEAAQKLPGVKKHESAFDEAKNSFTISVHYAGQVEELYAAVAPGLTMPDAPPVALLKAAGDRIQFVCGERLNDMVVKITGLAADKAAGAAEAVVSTLKGIPGVRQAEHTYQEKEATLAVRVRLLGTASDLDAGFLAAARAKPELKDLVPAETTGAGLVYRFHDPSQPVTITVQNLGAERYRALADALRAAVSGDGNEAGEPQYNEEAHTVVLTVKTRRTATDLDKSLWNGIKGKADWSDLTLLNASARELQYTLPAAESQTTRIRLSHLDPDTYQTLGPAFVDLVGKAPGVTKVEKTYDTGAKTLELVATFKGRAGDVDAALWRGFLADPVHFKTLYPGDAKPGQLAYVLKTAPETCPIVLQVKRVSEARLESVQLYMRWLLGSLPGTKVLADRHDPELQLWVAEIQFEGRPAEFEEKMKTAMAAEPKGRVVEVDGTNGSMVLLTAAQPPPAAPRPLRVRIEGFEEPRDAEIRTAVTDALKGIPGAADVSAAASGGALDIRFQFPGTGLQIQTALPTAIKSLEAARRLNVVRATEDSLTLALAPAAVAQLPANPNPTGAAGTANTPPVDPVTPPVTPPADPPTGTGTPTPGPVETAAATPPTGGTPLTDGTATANLGEMVKGVDPCVVFLEGRSKGNPEDQWLGSGFIVSPRGYILTNAHVVNPKMESQRPGEPAPATTLRVKTADGHWYAAEPVAMDLDSDLALVHIDATDLPAVRVGDSAPLTPGDSLFVIGNPLGLEHSVVTGIVSGVHRMRGRLQTNALINHGNSGGPAFNMKGEAIGVAVAGSIELYAFGRGEIQVPNPGINFIVPIEQARPLLNKIGETAVASAPR